jgi:hypothetical protein
MSKKHVFFYFKKHCLSSTERFWSHTISCPCNTSSSSGSQRTPCLMWIPKAHHHVHKSLPLVSIWTIYPSPHLTCCFVKSRLSIMPHLYQSFRLSDQHFLSISDFSHIQYIEVVPMHTMKVHGEAEPQLHSFLTVILDKGEWLTSHLSHLTAGAHWTWVWRAPALVWLL